MCDERRKEWAGSAMARAQKPKSVYVVYWTVTLITAQQIRSSHLAVLFLHLLYSQLLSVSVFINFCVQIVFNYVDMLAARKTIENLTREVPKF